MSFLSIISEILCNSRKLLYLCIRKINERVPPLTSSLVGDGTFFCLVINQKPILHGQFWWVRPYAERTRQNRYLFNKYYNEDLKKQS